MPFFPQEKVTGELSGPKLVKERGETEKGQGWKSTQSQAHCGTQQYFFYLSHSATLLVTEICKT